MLIVILIIFCIFIGRCMPFIFISNSSIREVEISFEPDGKKYLLNETEKNEFVNNLRVSVFLSKDESYRQMNGNPIVFYITKKNGKKMVLMEAAPYLIFNGNGYQSLQSICVNYQELAQKIYVSNELVEKRRK